LTLLHLWIIFGLIVIAFVIGLAAYVWIEEYFDEKNTICVFVVIENFVAESEITEITINRPYIIEAFKSKRQAFDLIEQFYYEDIEKIKSCNYSNISDVYIGNDTVRIKESYRLDNGSHIQFLHEYKIEKIPFE